MPKTRIARSLLLVSVSLILCSVACAPEAEPAARKAAEYLESEFSHAQPDRHLALSEEQRERLREIVKEYGEAPVKEPAIDCAKESDADFGRYETCLKEKFDRLNR